VKGGGRVFESQRNYAEMVPKIASKKIENSDIEMKLSSQTVNVKLGPTSTSAL
jgi:hypothetical protein